MSTVTKYTTIRVESIEGELGRFHVQSHQSRKEPHLVDLLAFEGNGACSCHDWKITCWNNIKAQRLIRNHLLPQPYKLIGRKTPNPKRTICKHIDAADWKFNHKVKRHLAELRNAKDGT